MLVAILLLLNRILRDLSFRWPIRSYISVSGQFQVAHTMNRAPCSSAVHSNGALPIGHSQFEFLLWYRCGDLKINLRSRNP
jgi:hypothetical protein